MLVFTLAIHINSGSAVIKQINMTSFITRNRNSTTTFAVMLKSCVFFATYLHKCNFDKRPIGLVQQFLAVVTSEGNQDLSRKSSDCKIYVVSNRNIEMKITTDRLYLSNNR